MVSTKVRSVTLALVTAAALVAPGGAQAVEPADPETCGREGIQPQAEIAQPSGGTATVHTQAGSLSLPTNALIPGVVASSTGFIDVVVEFKCLSTLHLVVTKDDGSEDPPIVDEQHWDYFCAHGPQEHSVEIGLDVGTFDFEIQAISCDGFTELRDRGDGTLVADPPLPV